MAPFIDYFFIAFASITIMASLMVVFSVNPVKAVLFLVLAFVACAGVWLLLLAEFLAVILVLVYIGAVMVLFLFVVMMLDINKVPLKERISKYTPIGLLIAIVILAEIIVIISDNVFDKVLDINAGQSIAVGSNTEQIGILLFTEYLFSFELAALVLLVAMVLALVLTLGNSSQAQTKYLDVAKQIKVRSQDRLKIIKDDDLKND